MDKSLLEILACPQCKNKLLWDKSADELVCKQDQLAFPIRDGIPVMLLDEARDLSPGAGG